MSKHLSKYLSKQKPQPQAVTKEEKAYKSKFVSTALDKTPTTKRRRGEQDDAAGTLKSAAGDERRAERSVVPNETMTEIAELK